MYDRNFIFMISIIETTASFAVNRLVKLFSSLLNSDMILLICSLKIKEGKAFEPSFCLVPVSSELFLNRKFTPRIYKVSSKLSFFSYLRKPALLL